MQFLCCLPSGGSHPISFHLRSAAGHQGREARLLCFPFPGRMHYYIMKTLSNQSKFFILQFRSEWSGKVRDAVQGFASGGLGADQGTLCIQWGGGPFPNRRKVLCFSICCNRKKRGAPLSFFLQLSFISISYGSFSSLRSFRTGGGSIHDCRMAAFRREEALRHASGNLFRRHAMFFPEGIR